MPPAPSNASYAEWFPRLRLSVGASPNNCRRGHRI